MARINRVHEALSAWKQMEENNANVFSPSVMKSAEFAKLRLNRLDQITAKLSVMATAEEKDSLKILAIERKLLVDIAYPGKKNLWKMLSRISRPLKFLVRQRLEMRSMDRQLAAIQTSMQKVGFGGYVAAVFRRIQQGERNFSLPTSVSNHDNEQVYHNLNFSYNESLGHSFDSYQANYRNTLSPGIYKSHTFDANNNAINSKRAETLIAGRAIMETVTENGQLIPRWVKLDTKKDEQGNFLMKYIPMDTFDTHKHCQDLPFWKNIELFAQLKIVGNLMAGNRAAVNVDYQGKPLRVQVESDPEGRMIKVFDETGKPVDLKKLGADQTQKQAQSKSRGKAAAVKTSAQKSPASKKQPFRKQGSGQKAAKEKVKSKLSH